MSAEASEPRRRELQLLGRPECHLCAEAAALLRPLAAELQLELTEIDIERDERLLREFLEAIPVIRIDDVELARLDQFRANGFAERLREFVLNSY